MAARFLFIFFLAKYLDPASIGYYGVFAATVGYALYFVGLDYYTYVSREILKLPPSHRGQMLKGQAALSGILYLILFPVALWGLGEIGWPSNLVWWFIPIVLLEHFNQEISRLMLALTQPLFASWLLFVRQGSWGIVVIIILNSTYAARNLNVVIAGWGIAGIVAVSMAVWKLKKLKIGGWTLPVDWLWVRRGISVSIAFLVGTLALRGVFTFDRYLLERLVSIEMVGAYVLLFGVANTLVAFLEAAVFAFSFPVMIKYNHEGEIFKIHKLVNRLLLQVIFFSIIFGIFSWILLPYLISWIDRPIYMQALPWYPWLLSAAILNAVGMVPHLALYAMGVDRPIIFSHIAAFLIFGITTWLFGYAKPNLAVLLGINAALLSIFVWNFVTYLLLRYGDSEGKKYNTSISN
jgi:O-antigen/teichoic acid export membrane protein